MYVYVYVYVCRDPPFVGKRGRMCGGGLGCVCYGGGVGKFAR